MSCQEKIVEQLNGYDEKLRAGEDVDFWIRAAISGAKFVYQQDVILSIELMVMARFYSKQKAVMQIIWNHFREVI
jgi:hypothetical protein